jgi:hypothetical protein
MLERALSSRIHSGVSVRLQTFRDHFRPTSCKAVLVVKIFSENANAIVA